MAPALSGVPEGEAAFARGEYAIARQELEAGAERRDRLAQTLLGLIYLDGRGVPVDERRAVALIQWAAEAGYAHAQYLLGTLYATGRGMAKSDVDAAQWYRLAAEQGHSNAQGRLGLAFSHGSGIAQHDAEAAAWWQRGASQGDTESQGRLGIAYYDGAGVSKDLKLAYQWLLLAAAGGGGGASAFRYQRFVDRIETQLSEADLRAGQDAAKNWRPQVVLVLPAEAPRPFDQPIRAAATQRLYTGSGVLVAPGRVTTNNHVTDGCQRLRVAGDDSVRLLASDAKADLALIEWPGSGARVAARLRSSPASVGEAVTVAGFPLNGLLGFNVTTGNVSSSSGMRGDVRMLQISAPVQPGNSGGPLLDMAGDVIGIVVSKLNALQVARVTGDLPQNVNFAIQAGVLARFLAGQGVAYGMADSDSAALSTQEVAKRATSFAVLVECWR